MEKIKLQLAFSSGDLRRASRVMLLLQTENDRSYYLKVAITSDGFLEIEEDREGSAFGAVIERNFLNNIRHSVYYQRTGDDAMLLIDREKVSLEPKVVSALTQVADVGSNSVQIGGINTTDPRFAGLKSYSGCLSSSYKPNILLMPCSYKLNGNFILICFHGRYFHSSEQLLDETTRGVHAVYKYGC